MIIILPEDEKLVIQFGKKLNEYVERLEAASLSGDARARMSALCKIAVLKALLKEGRVDSNVVKLSLKEYAVDPLFSERFENACGVIEDYCVTRGANLVGGTGLPSL